METVQLTPDEAAQLQTAVPLEKPARIERRRSNGRRSDDRQDAEMPLDPAEVKTREDARRRLMDVKRDIQVKSAEMLGAAPQQVPILAQELQRLRVAMLMLREIVEDVADPNTYREISLLNKMMTGLDPEEDAKRRQQQEGEDAAQQRLAEHGIDQIRAGNMIRAFEALQRTMNQPVDDDGSDDSGPAESRPVS